MVLMGACRSIQVGSVEVGEEAAPLIVPPLELAWTHNAGAGFGVEPPHIRDNIAFVGTRRGEVIALSLEDGQRLGAKQFGESIEGSPVSVGGDLVVPIAFGKYALASYSVNSGRSLWSAQGEAVVAGILAMDDGFVVADAEGTVRRYDTSGEILWAATPGGRVRSRPARAGGRIIVADENGCVSAVAADDGSVLWQHCQGRPVYAPLAMLESVVIVPTTRGVVEFVDAEKGELVSTYAVQDRTVRFTAAGTGGEMVVMGTSDGRLVALSHGGKELLWEIEGMDSFLGGPLIVGRYVYAASTGAILYAVSLESGSIAWQIKLRGRTKTGLAAAHGKLLVLTEPRHVQAFRTTNTVIKP